LGKRKITHSLEVGVKMRRYHYAIVIVIALLAALVPVATAYRTPDTYSGVATEEEYDVLKTHPSTGEDILSHIKLFGSEKKVIRHHHERWDGGGYPDGISGEDIPLLSRILAVADTFDAMTNDRPYRKGLTIDTAVNELNRNRNLQFDETVVDAFISTL